MAAFISGQSRRCFIGGLPGITGNVLLVSVSALIGNLLTTEPMLATLPVATQFGGMLLVTLSVSLLMKRIGRRRGCFLGNLLGIFGAAVCILGLDRESLMLFSLGTALIGSCISQLYRFPAVDA